MAFIARMSLSVFAIISTELFFTENISVSGRDKIVKEERTTTKSAEGYVARLTFKKAKEEGIIIAVQWQDADSSSSNAVIALSRC